MSGIRLALAAAASAAAAFGGLPAAAQDGKLLVELNKLETFEAGCRSFFLFRNRSGVPFTSFEMSLAILDGAGVIDRLLTIQAAPLPRERTTLKLFEIPGVACEDVGAMILHDIASCTGGEADPSGDRPDCFALIDLTSLAPAPLVK